MARFVATPEAIEEINRLYYECGVKAEVARRIGCSPSTVSRYIVKGWQPASVVAEGIEEILERKDVEPKGMGDFINVIAAAENPLKAFCDYCKLSNEEWEEMRALQAEFVTTI